MLKGTKVNEIKKSKRFFFLIREALFGWQWERSDSELIGMAKRTSWVPSTKERDGSIRRWTGDLMLFSSPRWEYRPPGLSSLGGIQCGRSIQTDQGRQDKPELLHTVSFCLIVIKTTIKTANRMAHSSAIERPVSVSIRVPLSNCVWLSNRLH